MEGLHAVLRPPRTTHGADVYLPGADEQGVQDARPQGYVRGQWWGPLGGVLDGRGRSAASVSLAGPWGCFLFEGGCEPLCLGH